MTDSLAEGTTNQTLSPAEYGLAFKSWGTALKGSKSGLALFIGLSLNVLFGTAILLPDDGEHFIIDRVKRTDRITVRSFRPFMSPSQNWSRELTTSTIVVATTPRFAPLIGSDGTPLREPLRSDYRRFSGDRTATLQPRCLLDFR